MKKMYKLATMMLVCGSVASQAQDVSKSNALGLKPQAGTIGFEVTCVPLSQTAPISMNGIKLRYFNEDNFAYRLGFDMNFENKGTTASSSNSGSGSGSSYGSSSSSGSSSSYSTDLKAGSSSSSGSSSSGSSSSGSSTKLTTTYFAFNVTPGFEKHFNGNNRLSPYCGGEFNLGFSLAGAKAGSNKLSGMDANNRRSGFGIGAGFVCGADYYILKDFFVGIEFGYRLQIDMLSKVKSGSTTLNESETDIGLGSTYNSGFRLGYNF